MLARLDASAQINEIRACRHGLMIYNRHDQYVGRSLALYGEYSEGEVELFRQLVQPGQVIVEAGANLGAHTLFLAQAVGPTGVVFAFEPQRIVFQTLCANLALNEIMNVVARQAALGQEPGTTLVPAIDYSQSGNFGRLELGQWQTGEAVEVQTLDQLNLPNCHLIKVDVEGMEAAVLEGARLTIERSRPILYVENDRQDRSRDLIALIQSLGYRLWWHLPPFYNPDNFDGNPDNVFGEMGSANMLCLPQEATVNISLPEILEPQDSPWP
jgi:FkbM family methyltransferase